MDKPKVIYASHLFKQPHRPTRPDHFVIILRGLPGTKVCMYNMFCKHDDVTAENYRSSLAISLAFCVFDPWPYSGNHLMHLISGSGKSYLAKMLRDLEVENGGDAPRIHSMDDYFMTEVEKVCCFFFFFSFIYKNVLINLCRIFSCLFFSASSYSLLGSSLVFFEYLREF